MTATADVVFVNGPVVTVDETYPHPEAVAVTGDRITAVGTRDEVMALRSAATEIVDLSGRALLPGFVEAHTHPTQEQLLFTDAVVDIRPVTIATADGVDRAMRDACARTAAGRPLVFNGLDALLQKGAPTPTKASLDALAGDRPVAVWHNSGHLAWGNTAALRYAGLPADAPDPAGGRFGRDEHGHLDGSAYETPAILALIGPMIASLGTALEPLAAQHAGLAARGITMCSDMGFSDRLRPLVQKLYDTGRAKVRMRVYEMSDPGGAATVPLANGDDMFKQIGVKLWADGSPWVGTVATSFPYLDTPATRAIGLEPGHRGHANYTPEQLDAVLAAYYPAGWQMSCHVHGDLGVDMILDAYAKALAAHPRDDHRLRLEHCGAMTAEQYRRARTLGVTCSLFVDHLYYWGDVLEDDLFGAEHGSVWMRAKSALDAGVRISFHNDAPVTPEEPLRNMATAITRRGRSGRVHGPAERIGFAQALRAQTIDAAYQLFADDVAGSITPGKYADFAVLEADPRTTDPDALAGLAVTETWLGGARTYGG